MKFRTGNVILLIASVAICVYVSEFLLGFYLVKSLLHYPVPPFSRQGHATVDYSVSYRYNNISLRGGDFQAEKLYDVVLLGDSFLFGQGVNYEETLQGNMEKKGHSVLNLSEIATNPIDYHHKLKVMLSHDLKARNIVIGLCMGNDFQNIGDKLIGDALSYSYRRRFLDYGVVEFIKLERLRYQIRVRWIKLSDAVLRMIDKSGHERIIVHDFEHPRKYNEDWVWFFAGGRAELMKAMRSEDVPPISSRKLTELEYMEKNGIKDDSLKNTVRIINAIAAAQGPAQVWLMLIPDPYYASGHRFAGYDAYVDRLIAGIDRRVRIINLHPLLTPDMHFPHDGHWNAKGHGIVADVTARELSRSSR